MQRLESIGTLAGGIAHDLNNVLTPILMSAKLLKRGGNSQERLLEMIVTSAERGGQMITKLLSFAGGEHGVREHTLFLDEIGDMSPLMQTKILRVLQDQTFERVGGSETIRTNARLIAATNRDLDKAIENKEFRSDLYYRLNVYTIRLPPLCERGTDIRLLANHFLRRFGRELDKSITGIAPEAMDLLMCYRWPGNVRELQSALRHALLEATGPVIVPGTLPDFMHEAASTGATAGTDAETQAQSRDFAQLTRARLQTGSNEIHHELISIAERQIFTEVLKHTDGNLTQAARRLGITRTTLRARLEALGMSVERSAKLEHKTPE